jgi:hypothetical protein
VFVVATGAWSDAFTEPLGARIAVIATPKRATRMLDGDRTAPQNRENS